MDRAELERNFQGDPYPWLKDQIEAQGAVEVIQCLRDFQYFDHAYLVFIGRETQYLYLKKGPKKWRVRVSDLNRDKKNGANLPAVIMQAELKKSAQLQHAEFLENLWFSLCQLIMDAWLPECGFYLRSLIPHIRAETLNLPASEQTREIERLKAMTTERLQDLGSELDNAITSAISRLLDVIRKGEEWLPYSDNVLLPFFINHAVPGSPRELLIFFKRGSYSEKLSAISINSSTLAGQLIEYRLKSSIYLFRTGRY